jgi:peptidoglycan hydrolase CwlO-like protein|tara:strand:+ start:525 stop:791 length:267 start_codon:yes stop_codon:yes gene_type:complete
MIEKLQKIGLLITLVSVIGGGFYTWGTFNQRLDAIENKEFVVNETVDLSGIQEQISELKQQLAIIEAKVNFTDAKVEELKADAANPFN